MIHNNDRGKPLNSGACSFRIYLFSYIIIIYCLPTTVQRYYIMCTESLFSSQNETCLECSMIKQRCP